MGRGTRFVAMRKSAYPVVTVIAAAAASLPRLLSPLVPVRTTRKSAYAIAAALTAAIILSLLGLFSPAVQARAPEAALAEAVAVKGDRLDVPLLGTDCSQREWPYFENACMRNASTRGAVVRQPRMISVDRLSARDGSTIVAER
jgi:hypothetical protein